MAREASNPLDLIGQIYEAALDPGLWKGVLRNLGGNLGEGGTFVGFYDKRNQSAEILFSVGFGAGFLKRYSSPYSNSTTNVK